MIPQTISFLGQWLDLFWLAIPLFLFPLRQKIRAGLFILGCVLMLRLQVEMMEGSQYDYGVLPLWNLHVLPRGFIIYGVFIAGFLLLSHFSHKSNDYVYIAASIGIFVTAFMVSTISMLL